MAISNDSKIYVAGHTGMVGSAIVRHLKKEGYKNLILKNRQEIDLIDQYAVKSFFEKYQPEYVFICAAKVGGIHANNTYRAQFIYENLQIQNNLIHFAHESGVKKLLFLGSSCIYPRDCPQPVKEEYLLTGPLEKTNEPYAIAKIAGIKMCESYYHQHGSQFFSIMPTNAYGPNDNYDLETSHVMAAIIRKIYLAKNLEEKNFEAIRKNLQIYPISHMIKYDSNWSNNEICKLLENFGISMTKGHTSRVALWGTGKPLREFIYVDDVVSGALFTMNLNFKHLYNENLTHLNVGTGEAISIARLAEMIANEIKYQGQITFDITKLDGTPKKCMNVSYLNKMGWRAEFSLEEGFKRTIKLYG